MILNITGKLIHVTESAAAIESAPFVYEVLVGDHTRRQLQGKIGESVQLHTLDYIEGNTQGGGRLTPRLIGFSTEPERQFFDLFCSVDGVGVKKALRAMVRPVSELADMIAQQDAKGLSALPGIGPATSERIIAKLRRKMTRFALHKDFLTPAGETSTDNEVANETFDALVTLGHSEAEAKNLIDGVLATKKKFKDTEAMLTAIYQKTR